MIPHSVLRRGAKRIETRSRRPSPSTSPTRACVGAGRLAAKTAGTAGHGAARPIGPRLSDKSLTCKTQLDRAELLPNPVKWAKSARIVMNEERAVSLEHEQPNRLRKPRGETTRVKGPRSERRPGAWPLDRPVRFGQCPQAFRDQKREYRSGPEAR